MSDERPLLMLGLHGLSAEPGGGHDGLVPELHALIARRAALLQAANVVVFPVSRTRPPVRGATDHAARNDNVVAFPVRRAEA